MKTLILLLLLITPTIPQSDIYRRNSQVRDTVNTVESTFGTLKRIKKNDCQNETIRRQLEAEQRRLKQASDQLDQEIQEFEQEREQFRKEKEQFRKDRDATLRRNN